MGGYCDQLYALLILDSVIMVDIIFVTMTLLVPSQLLTVSQFAVNLHSWACLADNCDVVFQVAVVIFDKPLLIFNFLFKLIQIYEVDRNISQQTEPSETTY